MFRIHLRAFVLLGALAACEGREESSVTRPPPELVEITLGERGDRLTFRLPDAAWHQDASTSGLAYLREERSLRIEFCFKESEFSAFETRTRAAHPDADVRTFEVGQSWPFLGVAVSYRGPPDVPMLDAFVQSFRYERR